MTAGESTSRAEDRFERTRHAVGAVLAPVVFGGVFFLARGTLSPEGAALSAVLSAVVVLWITEPIPIPVTALLGACLCVVFGVANAATVFAPFADPIVFLFMGSFFLAQAMMRHGLDRRLALGLLSIRWVGGRPARVLLMFGAGTAALSMWVSNTATAAMMAPIAIGVLRTLRRPSAETTNQTERPAGEAVGGGPFATVLLLMVAYAASVGGNGTPVGSPPNLICIGQIRKLADGFQVGFFQWMALTVPAMLLMYGLLFVLLRPACRVGRDGGNHPEDLAAYFAEQRSAGGPWTLGQIHTLVAFGFAVTLWVLPGGLAAVLGTEHPLVKGWATYLPESVVAVLAAVALFILPIGRNPWRPTLRWDEAVGIDWGTILLFGGGLSFGSLMFQTGVAQWLGEQILAGTGISTLWGLTAIAVLIAILITEVASNTAAATMVIPLVIALAHAAGVSPVPPALGACLGANCAFMLPVSTPPNAIVYGTGMVPITKMIRVGILFDMGSFVVIMACLRVLCPLLGLA